MTPDILTSLQVYANTQNSQLGTVNSASQEESQTQDGKFAAFMTEYTLFSEELSDAVLTVAEDEQPFMIFTGNNSLPLNILTGNEETAEMSLHDEDTANLDEVIWPEDEKPPKIEQTLSSVINAVKKAVQKITDNTELTDKEIQEIAENVIEEESLDDVPDALRQEILYAINDIAAALRRDNGKDTQPVIKLLGVISERIAPTVQAVQPKPESNSEEPDIMPDALDDVANLAGVAVITNFTPQDVDSNSSSQLEIQDDTPRTRQHRAIDTPQVITAQEQQETPEVHEITQTFREVFVNHETEQEDPGHDQTGNQSQGFSQGRGESGAGDSSSHSRNNTRRTDLRTPTDNAGPTAGTSTRRTDSHSDFAAYFEGVLTSRRIASRTSPEPLNLRGTENFTQSSVIRDGLVNVVRFIRADGLQKARVIVDPPALGRISVELTSGTSGVEASIKVSSEQIRQLVQDQLSELRMNLSQQGVQVAEFTVDVQQDNSGSQNQQGQQQNRPYMNFFDDADDDETEEFRVDLEEGLLYWVA